MSITIGLKQTITVVHSGHLGLMGMFSQVQVQSLCQQSDLMDLMCAVTHQPRFISQCLLMREGEAKDAFLRHF